MEITASMVKDLREKTAAGMMDCKKALNETNGDFEAAVDWLRKNGISKADKKASRVAAEGLVMAVSANGKGAMVEVNSETDFVAKNDEFKGFVEKLANLVLTTGETDIDALAKMDMNGTSVSETLTNLIAKIGENMNMRRAAYMSVEPGVVAGYTHMGGKIGVLTAIEGNASKLEAVAKQVSMHVAATNPAALDRSSVDNEAIERERSVLTETALASGKPEAIVAKIVDGQIAKYYKENCLTEQAFVINPDQSVSQAVASADKEAKIDGFVRFVLGEGIEKEESDFAAEVAAAVNG